VWRPGTRHGYHAITLGWYEGELIRRVDPAGRSLGHFFAEEIAKPLGLEVYIGLPASVDRARVAHLYGYSEAQALLHLNYDAAPVCGCALQSVQLVGAGPLRRQGSQRF
jgi:CubicO group peptidase (beta-lactamase class C family)